MLADMEPIDFRPASATPAPGAAGGLPPEYSRLKRPRPSLRLGGAGSGCLQAFFLIWTLLGACFLLVSGWAFVRDYTKYNRLLREGVTTTATITRLYDVDTTGPDGGTITYYMAYQFTAPVNGAPTRFEDSDDVSWTFYRSRKTGQEIEILYAASDPTITAITAMFGPPDLRMSTIFIGVGGLFVLVGVGLLAGNAERMRRFKQLQTQGRPAQAVVFDRWQEGGSSEHSYFVAFAFQADLSAGQSSIITHAEENKTLYERYRVGDTLAIRYLPAKPTVCQAQLERSP